MNIHIDFHAFNPCTIPRTESRIICGPWPWEVYIYVGRKHNNTQFIFNQFCNSYSEGNGNTVEPGGVSPGRGTSNQHFSGPCRSWHGKVSSQRKGCFFFVQKCLPRSLRGAAHSKSQRGEVLTRDSPGGWRFGMAH